MQSNSRPSGMMPTGRESLPFIQRIQLRESPPSWSLSVGVFLVIAYVVLWIAGQIIVAAASGPNEATTSALVYGAVLGCVVSIFVVVQWARRRLSDKWADELHLKAPINPPLFAVILIGLGAAWALDLIGVLLKIKGDMIVPPVLQVLGQPIGVIWAAAAILAILVQPIADGLIFAGVLYPALTRDLKSNVMAAVVTAVVYTVISVTVLSPDGGLWYALIQPLVMALVVMVTRAYTQSTQSAIVARALFGLFFVLAALIAIRFS